nr:macrophage colony-stimulating factor 1a [Misgurnus anguillicaudatus]
MNTHITAHKAKVRHQWFVLILCFYLVYAGVPGPCKHSVTQGHLLNLRRLIKNQLQNGCSITYSFTERQNLSVVCYVKAAFPHILELLNTQFRYAKDSDNYRYTNSLKNVIYNIYSQGCIPLINEELENSPVKTQMTSAKAALEKAEEVIHMYVDLMTKSDKPVDWNCEEEYTEDYPESFTEPFSQSPGVSQCPCTCPASSTGTTKTSLPTNQWNIYLKSTPIPQRLSFSHVDGRSEQPKSDIKQQGSKSNPSQWISTTMTPIKEALNNFPIGSSSVLMDKSSDSEMEYTPSPGVSPSLLTIKELPDFLPGTTDFIMQSTPHGPYQQDTGDSIQRSTALLLAKRSLHSKSQEGSSNSHNKLLQTWLSTTSDPTDVLKTVETGIPPVAKDKPFQMLRMSKHMVPVTSTGLPSLKTDVHLSEHLTELVEQLGHPNSPHENVQIQTPIKEHKNIIKTISETKLNQDSRSQEDYQEIHTAKDDQDRGAQMNSAMTKSSGTFISFSCVLIITLVCGGLLL